MTAVSVAGFVICILAICFVAGRLTVARLMVCVLLLFVHIAATLYYYDYSQTQLADSSGYYFDPLNWANGPWGLSTIFVTQLCHVLKVTFDATYVDCFILFQAFGFVGMMLMVRVFDEIETNIGVPEHRGYLALLFLPSVNFWTAAIGKDAPLFLAIALCIWAMLNLRRRFISLCISVVIMILFRAHIALLAAIALAGAAFFGTSVSATRKIALVAVAAGAFWLTSRAVQSSFGVDATSLTSVSDFIDKQNSVFENVGGNTSFTDAPFALRVVSLLFRPFFFDAHGALGVVASVENVGSVLGFLYAIVHWRDLAHLAKRVFFIRFVLIFAFAVLLMLSLVYYNVGLGLRQRVMAYPMIFSILVALWSFRRKQGVLVGIRRPTSLMVEPKPNRAVTEL